MSYLGTRLDFYTLPFNLRGKNWIFDNWGRYINSLTPDLRIDDFQFLRVDSLSLKIKVNLNQIYSSCKAGYNFNYLKVTLGFTQSTYAYYFYKITKITQLAEYTIELDLELDVLNTYERTDRDSSLPASQNAYQLSDKSVILREHKSRLNNVISNYSERNIDKYSEGIDTILFKKKEQDICFERTSHTPYIDVQNTWYLVYMNNNDPVSNSSDTQSKYVNPVRLFIASDLGYRLNISGIASAQRISADSLSMYWSGAEELLFIRNTDMGTARINITWQGVTYTLVPTTTNYGNNEFSMIMFRRQNNTDTYFTAYGYKFLNNDDTSANAQITNLGTGAYFDILYCDYCLIAKAVLFNDPSNYSLMYGAVSNNTTIFTYSIGSDNQYSINDTGGIFSNINLTDPKLIKIIALPYSPLDELNGKFETNITTLPPNMIYNTTYRMLEFSEINDIYFNYQKSLLSSADNPLEEKYVDFTGRTISISDNRDITLESKLFHSDYYLPKFVYDSFTFNFQLELCIASHDPFRIDYVVSKNVTSKFMFRFATYITDGYDTQDYNNILIIERNNEVTLYTNEYMNYMRLGYKFDTKSMEKQNVSNWVGVALSSIGAVASFISSIYTGGAGIVAGVSLLTTATGGTIRAVQSAQQNDRNLAQKQLQLQAQSTSVSSSSDLDLLKAYSGNVAKICYYGLSDVMKQALFDYFYYNGYATRRYLNNNLYECERINFNFVQAEIEIYNNNRINSEHLEKIKQCYKDGVTIFHYYRNGYYTNDSTPYEYKQIYENWEKDFYDDYNS